MPKAVIIEDNFMIADMVEDMLVLNGYDVCGIAATVNDAVALCHAHHPDLAIIDVRLAEGQLGTQVAAQLVPFGKLGILYVTGNKSQVHLSRVDGHACLSKPYLADQLLCGLAIVTDIVNTGHTLRDLPRGFHLLEPIGSAPESAPA